MIHAGADGCLNWQEPLSNVLTAIRTVMRDEIYLGPLTADALLRRASHGESLDGNLADVLSERELDVFTMIGQGLTTQQIANRMDMSPRTVESHRKNIKMKLGVRNAAQLNRRAFQWWHEHGS